jgi:excisionase family DNA binding protein
MAVTKVPVSAVVDPLWGPDDVSAYTKVPVQTLYRWRVEGKGPRASKLGRHLRYRKSDVDAWVDAQSDDRPAA